MVVRFRQRDAPNDDSEPPQVYGSTQIELAWTVIPILIVVVLVSDHGAAFCLPFRIRRYRTSALTGQHRDRSPVSGGNFAITANTALTPRVSCTCR